MGCPVLALARCGSRVKIRIYGIVFAAIYLTIIYYISFGLYSNSTIFMDDGLWYSRYVDQGEVYIHPHHLFYHVITLIFHNFLVSISPSTFQYAVTSLHLFSSVTGSVGVVFFFLAMRYVVKDEYVAAFSALLLAFCRGYWFYAALAETIVPGGSGSLVCFYLLTRLANAVAMRGVLWLGICSGLAIFIRQDNALFVIPCASFICIQDVPQRRKAALVYCLVAVGLAAMVYLTMYVIYPKGEMSIKGLYSWVTLYHAHPNWGAWHNISWEGVKVGLARICGSMGIGALDRIQCISLDPIPRPLLRLSEWISLGEASILLLIALCTVPQCARRGTGIWHGSAFCITWLAVREGFYLCWMHAQVFSWSVGSMVPIWALAGICVAECSLWHRRFWRAMLCVLGALVFSASVLMIKCGSADVYYERMLFYNSFSAPGDFIIVREFHDLGLLSYQGRRGAALVDYYKGYKERSLVPETLSEEIGSTLKAGRSVFLVPWTGTGSSGTPFHPGYRDLESSFFGRYDLTPCYVPWKGESTLAAWKILPKKSADEENR